MLLLALLSPVAAAQSEQACLATTIWMESRGEPLKASQGVYQVVLNRMDILGLTACEVVKAYGAFPWAAKRRNWKLTRKMLQRYEETCMIAPVVSKRAFYFNSMPIYYGKFHKKIGHLYFNLKE